MEQHKNLQDMPSMLSLVASFAASSLSVERACHDEDAEDNYDEGPEESREVFDVSGFLEKEAQA